MNSILAQLNSLSQLPLVRQLGLMLILAASIALGTSVVMWSVGSSYTALYTGLSEQDAANVVTALEQNGVNYRIDSYSGIISVPSDELRQVRMQLASEGLPRSTQRGFDFLSEEQSLGTSNFVEQARYNHALEQELTLTIKQIQGIRDARVHLSIPRQNSFIRNSRKPSASVMIDIAGVQELGDTQLSGILHLVTSSVAGLETDNVSIVDQRGNLLSDRSDSSFGNSTEAMRLTRTIEEDYSGRIINLLTPIVGAGNVRAQVSANIDFTAMETTEESYNPDTTVVRSEQLEEESAELGNGGVASTEPGDVSPVPPAEETAEGSPAAQDNNRQTRTSTVRNYELDRSVRNIRTVPGAIEQLSVAVLVDLSAADSINQTEAEDPAAEASEAMIQARIDRLTQLVRDAVGFNETRGDTVSVINEQFFSITPTPPEAIPFYQQSWFVSTLKQIGAGLVVLLLILGVLRPALKSVVSRPGQPARLAAPNQDGTDQGELQDDQVHLSGNASQQQLAMATGGAGLSYDENLARAQNLVLQEPARAARMIQGWLESE